MEYGILIVILFVAYVGFTFVMRNKYSRDLSSALIDGNYEEFDKLTENRLVRFVVPLYNLDCMKLNRYQMVGDMDGINDMFKLFKSRNLSFQQKQEIYPMAFNHYLIQGNREECEYYKKELDRVGEDELKNTIQLEYDIFIDKKTDMLEDLLQETEELEEKDRGLNEFLIAQVYRNLGLKEEAEKYADLSQSHEQL